MCGIVGFIERAGASSDAAARRVVLAMADSLRHRGPDDGGSWNDEATGVALGHRRLSVVDLSPAGHQPMTSACGRFVIVYNGEIYNAAEVRTELETAGQRPSWRGHSDTEIILEACAHWGVEAATKRLIGMFAFALWDRKERHMALVRDRLGIKPLYWGQFGDLFVFGSELKALRCHPGWRPEIDRNAITAFLRHNYIPAPHSIYRGVRKLEPGHILIVSPGSEPVITAFWSMEEVARSGQAERLDLSDADAIDRLESLLMDAVGRRMIADVPLGALLSGGIDSSTVVALMQAQSPRPIRTFSIGFREQGYNEAQHAKAVAAHLGTDHTELYVEPSHALEVIPRLPTMFDEPFADSSQVPTFLVSEMTRAHVTVALSGDGGDELFAGYNRYLFAAGMWRRLGLLPPLARRAFAGLIHRLSPQHWNRVFGLAPARWLPPQPGDKLHKLAGILAGDADAFYLGLVSHWQEPETLVLGATEPRGLLWDPAVGRLVPDFIERMQYLDTRTYLPDDILVKVDRASMAVALEARVPLLDHRVVEFAWKLPPRFKIRHGQGKWLLRQVLHRHVPQALIDRPKMGFGIPIDSWLRGPLRDWAEALLDEGRLRAEGWLDPAPVRQKWREHLSGHRNWQYLLWDVLMLQAWLEHQKAG
ncbi:MAG: asparagine synthase (glutamine-hydrolyzing) [Alphaproteobacteria bacterium]|nr:asparagine synthase (glutamine-hydrolyzing) [Alphaproteobacteria bacterium]